MSRAAEPAPRRRLTKADLKKAEKAWAAKTAAATKKAAEAHARALRGRDATIAKLEREARVLGNAKAANEMFRLRANAAIGHIDAGRLERARALLDADLDPAPRA